MTMSKVRITERHGDTLLQREFRVACDPETALVVILDGLQSLGWIPCCDCDTWLEEEDAVDSRCGYCSGSASGR